MNQRWALARHQTCRALILDSQTPELGGTCLFFRSPSLWQFVIAAWADYDIIYTPIWEGNDSYFGLAVSFLLTGL